MIQYQEHTYKNGLKLIFHRDVSTPLAIVNVLYDVGAKDESPKMTGFAHLFEHLMFGGSKNIPFFDEPLQSVGGENNAFTSNDITNYYISLPAANLETAFWLESDRMKELSFTQKSLDVQKNVVVEEFKQNYLNQPYGDLYHIIRSLSYKKHPYRWPTIGEEVSHIESAKLDDVKDFFHKHYKPNRAIISVVGNFEFDYVKSMVEKWFGNIKSNYEYERNLPKEPKQIEARLLTVNRNVPYDAIYKSYHMCSRFDDKYFATDLISDILSSGDSSRFYRKLVLERKIFGEIQAYIGGDIDEGLFYISGKLVPGITIQEADQAINEELDQIRKYPVEESELIRAKNKILTIDAYGKISPLNKAMGLAYSSLLGDPNLINLEAGKYMEVDKSQISEVANTLFDPKNSSTIYYLKKES